MAKRHQRKAERTTEHDPAEQPKRRLIDQVREANEHLVIANLRSQTLNADLAQAQQSAAAARDHFEAIIRTIRDPFVILTADLRVETANEAFYKAFKAVPAETEGRLINDVGSGQWSSPRLRLLLEDILPRNSFFNDFEVTHEFERIGRRTMLLNARRLVDGGSAARILLGIHDVTEVLQFQTAARIAQARYRALVEASAQVIWTTDAAGAVVEDSPSWREFTGQTYEQWKGWGWVDAIHPDDRRRVRDLWLRTVASRAPLTLEYRLRRAGGGWCWTEVRVVPVFNTDGSVREWIGTNSDITERRALTDALREADRNKNVFLAMLAHELRNPLAPIRNSIEIVRRLAAEPAAPAARPGSDPETASRVTVDTAVAMMERQVGHMARLVDDLLDVSRISRGKITLHIERVDVSAIVRQAVDAALPMIEDKGQDVSITMPPEPVYANADPNRLAQIAGNLLQNAWKFTGHGGRIKIALETGAPESEAAQAVIRVRDTGIGLAAEQLARVFDMFQQVDASIERSGSGLGIGLTLVRTLAEMHGGTADAYSEGLGRGAEFVVRLPLRPDLPVHETTVEASPPPGPPRRILIVDDNADSADSLAILLRLGGHKVQTASDGLEAVKLVTVFSPDVVLLDIGLPGLNGYEVARRIREQAPDKRPRLVAVTGWGQDEDRRRAEEAGFDAHLVKPVDEPSLMKALLVEGGYPP